MQAIVTLVHTLAAIVLVHSYKKRSEREERITTIVVVSVIAFAGLAQMFLGIQAG